MSVFPPYCVRIYPVKSVLYHFPLGVKNLIFLNKGRINQLKPRILSKAKGPLLNIFMSDTQHPSDCQIIRCSLRYCKNRPYFPRRILLFNHRKESAENKSNVAGIIGICLLKGRKTRK